jgi:hypothetical protein
MSSSMMTGRWYADGFGRMGTTESLDDGGACDSGRGGVMCGTAMPLCTAAIVPGRPRGRYRDRIHVPVDRS